MMQKWACVHPDRHEVVRSFREWAKSLLLEERKRIDGFKFFCQNGLWRWECVIIPDNTLLKRLDDISRNSRRTLATLEPVIIREPNPIPPRGEGRITVEDGTAFIYPDSPPPPWVWTQATIPPPETTDTDVPF